MTIDAMIKKFGIGNSIIMIGSSNSYTERTPYSFNERKKMIKTVYPDIKVVPIPDMQPYLPKFDGTTNDLWLNQIKKIEESMKVKFIFVGGSSKDLEVLALKFDTRVLIERKGRGHDISATAVRAALEKSDKLTLEKTLDPRILPLAVNGLKKYHAKRN